MIEPLPVGPFKTIMIDPPWAYGDALPGGGRGAEKHYPTMTIDDIAQLRPYNVADADSHMYLWATNAFMADAYELLTLWNYTPKTIITWIKTTQDGERLAYGMGRYFRNITEHCIVAVRGKLSALDASQRNVIFAPRMRHSAKPVEIYDMIERASPGPYLELFARGVPRDGWTAWGNEVIHG